MAQKEALKNSSCIMTTPRPLRPSPDNPRRIVMERAPSDEDLADISQPSSSRTPTESASHGMDQPIKENNDNQVAQDEQDHSVAAACSLVGESIMDSPTHRSMNSNANTNNSSTNMTISSLRSVKLPSIQSNASENYDGPAFMSSGPGHNNLDHSSVGVVASGLAWVQRQRDQRQRQYLQLQAERQLRKIEQAEHFESYVPAVLSNNSTFRQLIGTTNSTNQNTPTTQEKDASAAAAAAAASSVSKSGQGASGHLDIANLKSEEDLLETPQVRVEPEDEDAPPHILNPEQMHRIASDVLPATVSYCRWKRLYSLTRDGDSFEAFMRILEDVQRTLLVVRTSHGEILGGFAGSPWRGHNQKSTTFYGSADAVLYNVINGTNDVEAYKWSGANRYIQVCDTAHKMIAFGGGGVDGAFGLCVENDFQFGSTGPCDTFANEPLCEQENFAIVELEVYGFLTGVF